MPTRTIEAGRVGLDLEILQQRHRIGVQELESVGLSVEQCSQILDDYQGRMEQYELEARFFADILRGAPGSHSVKFRVKDPYRLIEKIHRKRAEEPGREILPSNYCLQIQDLVALRVLHLYKKDWQTIGQFIENAFDVKEHTIYVRNDEEKKIVYPDFQNRVRIHPRKYRSVHYIVSCPIMKGVNHFVEIQIRTLIEEAWCEIDHRLRYSKAGIKSENGDILKGYIEVFNYFCGGADHMGSYADSLSAYLEQRDAELSSVVQERDDAVANFERTIQSLQLSEEQRKELANAYESLKERTLSPRPVKLRVPSVAGPHSGLHTPFQPVSFPNGPFEVKLPRFGA